MRVELAPAKNYSGAAAARSAARRLAARGLREAGRRNRRFGFHLPLGLLIKRDREIWFGAAPSALNGNARRPDKLGG
jgi:hypothetical protein